MSEDVSPLRKIQKKGLGRGLDSLLGEARTLGETRPATATETIPLPPIPSVKTAAPPAPTPEHLRIWNVAIENITPNREQPRRHFDQGHLLELANSIKEKGVLLPLVVRRFGDGRFEIIAGERRWRAAQLAGKKEVPVIVRTSENQEALELALIENIQRQNLNPIEEAEAYQRLAEKYGLTQQSIADKVGKDRATIANLMRLVTLAPEVKGFVKAGELQLGQAKVLMAIADKELQLKIAKKVVNLKLSVRATERIVAYALQAKPDELEIEDSGTRRAYEHLAAELQKLLGTKVKIEGEAGGRSRLSVQFYSTAELNHFVDKLRKATR